MLKSKARPRGGMMRPELQSGVAVMREALGIGAIPPAP